MNKNIKDHASRGGLARAKKLNAKRRRDIARLGGFAKGKLAISK